MGLGHADGQIAEAVALVAANLGVGLAFVRHAVRAVDLRGDGLDLLLDRLVQVVEELELARLFGRFDHGLGQFDGPGPAFGPVARGGAADAHLLGDLEDGFHLAVIVGR